MTIVTHAITNPHGGSSSSVVVPDGSPTYTELQFERELLLKRIEQLEKSLLEANQRADAFWGVVEDVATGATIECETCGKRKPCCCDKL